MTPTTKLLDDDRLVHKVNQIALFFEPYPHTQAVEGVADHLKKFWPPAMRGQLIEFAGTDEAVQLHALVREAVTRL
ncbi:MAG: formate dehydrogenase subunit delta [Pseudomonadota bacterium]|nr:MAG: formate dehydrogenase subunit delta [Pseudomonadota bacterium]